MLSGTRLLPVIKYGVGDSEDDASHAEQDRHPPAGKSCSVTMLSLAASLSWHPYAHASFSATKTKG